MRVVLGAIAANLLLLFALAWAAAPAGRRAAPVRAWTLREVTAAIPPAEAPRADEAPRETPREAPALQDPVPTPVAAAPAPEAPALRLDLPLQAPAPSVATMALPAPGMPAAAPAALDLARVDVSPRRLSTPLPPYPAWARSRRLEGSVTLRYVVDEDGAVRDLHVDQVTGDERFTEVAREAVSAWRYEPGRMGGRKVRVILVQTVRFQLVDR